MDRALVEAKRIWEHSARVHGNWHTLPIPDTRSELRFLSGKSPSVNWHPARKSVHFHPTEEQVHFVCDRVTSWYNSLLSDEQALLNKLVVIVTDQMEWIPPVLFSEAYPCTIPLDISVDGGLDVIVFLPFTQEKFTKEQESEFLATIIAHELEHVFHLIVSLKCRRGLDPDGENLSTLIGWPSLGFIEMGAMLAEFRKHPKNHHSMSYGADFLRHLHMGFLPAGDWYYFFPFLKQLWDKLGDAGCRSLE